VKGKKEFAILLFIIAVLAFYIFSEKGEKTHYKLPDFEKLQTDDISKLRIKKHDSEIELIREGDKWLAGPGKYAADNTVIDKMLEEISGLTLTALASESKKYAIYELDEKNKIKVEAYKDDSLLRGISVGKPASSYRHTFVMIDDDHRVFHAEGNIKSDFNKTISDLRDKTVMAFTDDITEIILKKGREEMTVVKATAPVSVDVTREQSKEEEQKTEEPGPKWTTADGKKVKENEVDGIVNTLSNLLCDEFIEDRTKDDFKSPIFTATLKGVNTYMIFLFEKKDNQYPAISSESEYPFLISEWKADEIMKDFGSLVE
jgi:hypothetical protein